MSNVQSVERAFAILEVVAAHSDGIGVTEVAKKVDLPKSTAFRLLSTLEDLDAVERLDDEDQDGFRLGSKIIELVSKAPFTQHLVTVARPYLLELAELTGESVGLGTPDGDQVHFVDHVQSQHLVQVSDWTDTRMPLHATASGKLFLASWSEKALNRYLKRPLNRFTSDTTTDPDQLRRELDQIRSQGYVIISNEYEDGLVSMAAPVIGEGNKPVGAVGVYGPAYRFPPDNKADEVIKQLLDTTNRISDHLQNGYHQLAAYYLQPAGSGTPSLKRNLYRLDAC